MQEKEKLPPTAWLSTLLIGIYTLFLAIVEARIAIFLLVFSGVFTTMLGGLTGVIAFLLAAGIFILFLVCLVTLVSSCLLFQKRKLQVDAWMKLIIFVIFSILSWLLFQSVWITLLLIIPAVLGMMILLKNKE